jgi:uncharacterized lipoprotein YddW (UPF0748 family)
MPISRLFAPMTSALALAAALALSWAGPFTGAARADAPYDSVAAATADSSVLGPIEYLWVLRNSLVSADDIPRLIGRARDMKVKGLIVQVVGRGDGWYRSDLLPYPEPIRERGRDPLGELIPLAHAEGLEVHAWVNCCLVWSGKRPPTDPGHVIRQHPEWVARLEDGRPMTRMSVREREKRMVEGVFLSPAHPGVRTWIANIVREIASRYPVDGIHLDYIRQPSVAIGYDPTSRAKFALEQGVDPAMFARLPKPERARMDSAWSAFQAAQVTAIVREVRDTISAVRPGIELSAAVLADTLTAVRRNSQPWSAWLRDGLLDRAYAMCYAPVVQTVLQQLAAMSSQVGTLRLVPGIAIYNTSPSTAAAKIRGARELGFKTVALYSYDSLWERQDLWDRLRSFLLAPRSPEETP